MSWDSFQRAVLAELELTAYAPLSAPAVAADAAIDSALLQRLAAAVGLPLEVLLACPDIVAQAPQLHANAAAKRALWPRLRQLRRDARG